MASTEHEHVLTDDDLFLFNEGSHFELYDKLGAHLVPGGARFAVWAPSVDHVHVVGDFNDWDSERHPLAPRGQSGIWEGFVPGVRKGHIYKLRVGDRLKADPYGFHHETPPRTGSIVWDLAYQWGDDDWMAARGSHNALSAPMSIYEVHLGSFARVPEDGDRALSYREIAPRLADHVQSLGFTHVELMPVMEHPFHGSWGYQVTGYFAPTSRYGTPQDFMFLVDTLHRRGIGVILDWVPAHFPTDEHGLGLFDGTHLYEHADPREGFHPDWGTYIFNLGRHEVRSFLISSAMFWLDHYHVDGLRVDGVASMLYRDYSRQEGEWIPNVHGGRENIEAIGFLRRMNEAVYARFPEVQTIAEESTAWPMVSRPTSVGGLGFGLKWDMGWMHDTLRYMARDPIHRAHHHSELTFRSLYAFHENFVLPLSHDEVVHGKGSLYGKMPGDEWQRLANLRLLYAYMWTLPAKKLLFMGGELGQEREWDHDGSVDWHLLDRADRRDLMALIRELNRLYREEPALHLGDVVPEGFEWVSADDGSQSALAYMRRWGERRLLVALNFTPVPRYDYRVGVEIEGAWEEVLNTDAAEHSGSGVGNLGRVEAEPVPCHGRPMSLPLTLPPLAAVLLRPLGPGAP